MRHRNTRVGRHRQFEKKKRFLIDTYVTFAGEGTQQGQQTGTIAQIVEQVGHQRAIDLQIAKKNEEHSMNDVVEKQKVEPTGRAPCSAAN